MFKTKPLRKLNTFRSSAIRCIYYCAVFDGYLLLFCVIIPADFPQFLITTKGFETKFHEYFSLLFKKNLA